MRIDEIWINNRLFLDPGSSGLITSRVLGYCLQVEDQVILNYDYGPLIKSGKDGAGIEVRNSSYHPRLIDSQHVGLSGLPNFSLNMKWYDKALDIQVLLESWNKYKNIFNFDKIISFLIYMDAIIIRDVLDKNTRILPMPSWDVCLLLPYYMKLCERIPHYEFKFQKAGDLGKQIKEVAKKLSYILNNQQLIHFEDLEDLLRIAHSLSDELRLASNVKDMGYDIRFGDPKSQPDYTVNDVPIEHKSRFSKVSLSSVKGVSRLEAREINEEIILKNLVDDLHEPDVGLKYRDGHNLARAYFDNLTRSPPAFEFWGSVKLGKFNFYKYSNDFSTVIRDSMKLTERSECVIPYVSPICYDPKLIGFPLKLKEYEK